ncbi:MAG: hypothetical protein H0X67_12855 [Acidobacteria bacterium]|nr:hypothetical protein [Acidobacteriota bacterium]
MHQRAGGNNQGVAAWQAIATKESLTPRSRIERHFKCGRYEAPGPLIPGDQGASGFSQERLKKVRLARHD